MDHFNRLNDDCLIEIFENLQLLDRLRLEPVCRRWSTVMPYFDINSVTIGPLKWPEAAAFDFFYRLHQKSPMTKIYAIKPASLGQVIRATVARIGKGEEIDLVTNGIRVVVTGELMQEIGEILPNVRRLNFSKCLIFDPAAVFSTATGFAQLHSLKLNGVSGCKNSKINLFGVHFCLDFLLFLTFF